MAGLYIHIPFCASRCIYCGFYSTTRLDLRQKYVDALCCEMVIRRRRKEDGGRRNDEEIETIYIGGGTPSQLSTGELRQLFIYINKVYDHRAMEITIEMNPDDVSPEYVANLSQLGINRVSMGAQTFDDHRLGFLRRRHTAAQVSQAVSMLRSAGIRNISVDLMYGFPGETLNDFRQDIDAALSLDVEHISAYCLMIEEGTVLFEQMRNEEMRNEETRNEERERAMYELLIDKLTAAGYEHYEISNFARPGFRSRHNSSYWHDIPYIGLGAAAHSYDGHSRSWNVSNIQEYIAAINCGNLPSEKEVIDEVTHYNDRITTALRTCDGLDLTNLTDRFRKYCLQEAQPSLRNGLLQLQGDCLRLTRQGLFVSDMVMSSLVMV